MHWVDFGGPDEPAGPEAGAPPVVLVHGLGGSHLNWVGLAPALTPHHRVYALDLAGFGLTPGAGRDTSVHGNAALLAQFLTEIVGEPAVLVGNSMGGMVSFLLAADRPDLVTSLVLIDPSIPARRGLTDRQITLVFLLYSVPRLGEHFVRALNARRDDERRVQATVDLCFADPTRADPAVVEAGVRLAAYRREHDPEGDPSFVAAARSLVALLRDGTRYASLIRSITAPILLVHGERDRLVPFAAAQEAAAANPRWDTLFLPGVGHTPQLEVPEVVGPAVAAWLNSSR